MIRIVSVLSPHTLSIALGFLMKLLDRHIFRELVGPFLFGVAAFTSIMFAGKELFNITELMAEYHAPVLTAFRLIGLFLPSLVVVTLPMAMLLSALLGFGRLSGDSEVIALFASGVSLFRIAIPVVLMGILVTGMSFVLSEVVAPNANAQHERLIRELTKDVTSSTKPILGQDVVDGVTKSVFYVRGGFDVAKGVARDIVVIEYIKNKPAHFIYGKEAIWKGDEHPDEWSFKDGYWKNLDPDQSVTAPFEKFQVVINKTPEQLELAQRKPAEMSFSQLRDHIHMLQQQGSDTRELRVKLYQKISLPLASLVFALIGTPLGLRPQRSSSAMGLGLSIVIIFGYWVLTHYMSILGENGTMSPAAASFFPTLAGLGMGVVLIFRATK